MASLPAQHHGPGRSFAGIAVLGCVVVLAASTPIPWSITSRFEFPSPGTGPTLQPPPADPPTGPTELQRIGPAWLPTVFWVVVGLALAVLAGWLLLALWRRRPRRIVDPMSEPATGPLGHSVQADPEALRRGAVTALELLDQIGEPRDAVVRSWLALERAAEASGAPRRPADSPTEFTSTVLRSTTADADAVARLLALYQRARFSEHPVGLAEVTEARACVLSLCRSWSAYETALRSSV